MNNTFVNLYRGNFTRSHLGLVEGRGEFWTYSSDYSYIELKLDRVTMLNESGDFMLLRPKMDLKIKNCKVLVVPNIKICTLGTLSYQSVLESGDDKNLGIALKSEVPISKEEIKNKIDNLCRIYVIYG